MRVFGVSLLLVPATLFAGLPPPSRKKTYLPLPRLEPAPPRRRARLRGPPPARQLRLRRAARNPRLVCERREGGRVRGVAVLLGLGGANRGQGGLVIATV